MFDFMDLNFLTVNALCLKCDSNEKEYYVIEKGTNQLSALLPGVEENTTYTFISGKGGFASINFIDWVARNEDIDEMLVATLAVGKKQIEHLKDLPIQKATFIVGSLFEKRGAAENYLYFDYFKETCLEMGWKYKTTNNHAKIILMKTKLHYYVLETSSNLNENPKIEQFSFFDNQKTYDFYYNFFNQLSIN